MRKESYMKSAKTSVILTVLGLGSAVLLCAQTGKITGTVTTDTGIPLPGMVVSASLRSAASAPASKTAPPAFMPIAAKATSDLLGRFEIDNLPDGAYALCGDPAGTAFLDPCLWAPAGSLIAIASGSAQTGATVVMRQGVPLVLRIADQTGNLYSHPATDDTALYTLNGKIFIQARYSGRDAGGKTMVLVVPPGQGLNLFARSKAFSLADSKGNSLTEAVALPLTAPALAGLLQTGQAPGVISTAGAAAALTVTVTGATHP